MEVPSEPLRVMYLIDHLGMGGAERMLATYLAHMDPDAVTPYVVVLDPRADNPIAETLASRGVTVEFVPIKRLRDPLAVPRLVRSMRRWRPDVVHNQLQWSIVLGGAAARILGIPAVATLHTMHRDTPRLRDRLRARITRLALVHLHDSVIAVSEAGRTAHIRDLGLDDEQVRTIRNGIDVDRWVRRDRRRVELELGIEESDRVLISVAVLREGKGLNDLIDAFSEVASEFPSARCLIVGDGPQRAVLARQAADVPFGDRISFLGQREDVPELLAAADVFVLPSHYEVLPTAIAEAMAAGVPVVATGVGGVPEMVEDGISGLLVAPGRVRELAHACLRLLQDSELAGRLADEAARVVRERFDVDSQFAEILDLYDSVLEDHRRLRPRR